MRITKILIVVMVSFILGVGVAYRLLNNEDIHLDEHGHDADHNGEAEHLTLDDKTQELIGIKTIKAEVGPIREKISIVGHIAQDTEFIYNIMPEASGEILECNAEVGSFVKMGDVLCTFKEKGSEGKIIELKAPVSGMVIGDFSGPGDQVDKVSSVHAVADLSKLWAILDVYEKDIAKIKLGQKVDVRAVAYPDKIFNGEIKFISPRVDENTRTIKVRTLVQNPQYLLKLGMFITADIIVESDDKYLILPTSAVFLCGDRKVVFIKTGENKFEDRDVEIIEETSNNVAIGKGITEGEDVVVEGGFLLKSEALRSQLGSGCAE